MNLSTRSCGYLGFQELYVYLVPRLFQMDILSWILGSIALEQSLRDARQLGDRSKIVSWNGQD